MRVLMSGSSGLVGTSLRRSLEADGHQVLALVRREPQASNELQWDPSGGVLDTKDLKVDAVVHLAGESIAEGRWSEAKKARIRDSRVLGTRALCEAVASLKEKPEVVVCASAIGYYGDRGASVLDETASVGEGFLSEVCAQWEDAAEPARAAGIRVVNLRIGVVLSSEGGALSKMLLPFRLGLGGKIGAGDQYMSWVSLPDLVSIAKFALEDETLIGPVNAVAPGAVTNLEFTRALGRQLKRPTLFPLPSFMARLALGEMADDLLLASIRVEPAVLKERGFNFEHPELSAALSSVLGGS
ncbi:MAG: TIGR01777 family oxidoreductase [Planctomycetota bacterium]|nr:TIGR01777 family oxidoreductase [Planctomycetota bacterium]